MAIVETIIYANNKNNRRYVEYIKEVKVKSFFRRKRIDISTL